MKKPLAIIVLLYVAGIVCGAESHVPLLTLFATAFAFIALSFFVKTARPAFILFVVFVSGWLNAELRTEVISPSDLRLQIASEPELVSIRGKISGAISRREYEQDGVQTFRSIGQIDVASIRHRNGAWQSAHGKILASTPTMLEEKFFADQPVEIQGVIRVPDEPVATCLFNYRQFLARQGIFFQIDAKYSDDWQLLPGASARLPYLDRFLISAQNILQRGLPEEDKPLRLLWAMTLGWRSALTDEVSEPFMRSGTMHIFAISGLHVALISGIIIALLRVSRVPRAWCGVIAIPLIWLYTAATGWQPSAIRSTVMMTIIITGWTLKRPSDLLNSLGAAAFIILIWDPLQIFQASFQLSFSVVLSLALLMPAFERIRQRLVRHDPLLPDELRPAWRRFLDVPVRFVTMTFVTSFAAWVGSMPLVAFYFHLLTPVSLLANMVIVPLSSLALMSNLGSLISYLLIPPLAEIFNHAGWFFMRLMAEASDHFANAPGAFVYVRSPSSLEFVFYYAFIFSVVTGWLFLPKRRILTIATVALLGSAVLWQWQRDRKAWQLTILPLAGGESIFVDAPDHTSQLLIDCGNESATHFVTKPFLRAQGVNQLTTLLLTHGDLKNIGGTSNIISDFKAEKILTSPVRFRSHTYRVLQSWLDSLKIKKEIQAGDQLGAWTVLHPIAKDKFSQADDGVVVLKGKIYATKILLLSDLSRVGQNLLWDRHSDLKADIVIAGLPRDSEPLKDSLLEKIQPKLIVITDSLYPAPERASAELQQRLRKRGVPILFCRNAGAVTLRCDERGFRYSSAR